MFIPKSVIITSEVLQKNEMVKSIMENKEVLAQIKSENCWYIVFIMDQIKNNSESFYSNYVSILPKDLSEFAELSSEEELSKMSGSSFKETVYSGILIKKHYYNILLENIPGFDQFTLDDFLRASVLV